MSVVHLKKRDVKSKVRGVDMEFDNEKLATILGVPGKNGICEYIKDMWEESKYTKPLEITRRFANDENLMAARRVKSGELKPFQRFVHFLVMKNVVPRFGKRDTSSFLDLTYMDHLMSRRLVNLPRVMIRHMSYVISMKDHELPYGDWLTMVFEAFGVPLVDKKGEEPKRYDFFEDTFLTMCKLTRENGIWWIGSGENRRRDDDMDNPEEETEKEDEGNEDGFDWEAVIDEAAVEGESGSGEKFYDAEDKDQDDEAQEEAAKDVASPQKKKQKKVSKGAAVAMGSEAEAVEQVEAAARKYRCSPGDDDDEGGRTRSEAAARHLRLPAAGAATRRSLPLRCPHRHRATATRNLELPFAARRAAAHGLRLLAGWAAAL
ncbi:hypothetical protein Dimus_024791 [Dionaea muscipula]